MKGNQKIPVIYLLGAGHSGSTLLDLIMGSHSQIFGAGELQQYFFSPDGRRVKSCMCGKTVLECPFWKKVFKNLNLESNLWVARKKINFLLNRENYFEVGYCDFRHYLCDPVDSKKYIELNEELYKNILKYSGKEIVFDSSKNPQRAELLLNSNKLDIILLHLVRNGKGVTWSCRNRHPDDDGKKVVWSCRGIVWSYRGKCPNFIKGVKTMYHWLWRNLQIEIIRRRNKVRYIFLRYEDFVKNPEDILTSILGQLGLSFEAQMMHFRNKDNHQVAGNPRTITKQGIEIKEDVSWKKEVPLFYKIIFDLLFGWLNIYYKFKKSVYGK